MVPAYASAHFFLEQGRPLPSEIASRAPGFQESQLCLDPQRFRFGAQKLAFSRLHSTDITRLSNNQLFLYGGIFCPPSLNSPFANGKDRLRNNQIKFIRIDRLGQV